MKKKILNSLKFISKIFDKLIIIPITKVLIAIGDILGSNGKKIERWLNNSNVLIILSLFAAISLYFFINKEAITLLENSADVLYNQKVTSIYNEEAYIVEGLPETVDITLIGSDSNLYLAKQIGVNEVIVDLSTLVPGTHKVELKYNKAISSISYKLDPSSATVVIYPKRSEIRTLAVDIVNSDKLDSKLIIDDVKAEKDEIIIKGADHIISQVATVKALVDVKNLSNPRAGELVLEDIPLIAYDESGNVIDVEIVPSKVNANITISSPNKSVPIRIIPTGDVAFGKAISSVEASVNSIQIYGDSESLALIDSVDVEVDVNELSDKKDYNLTILKPSGVNFMTVNSVNVTIDLGTEVTIEFPNVGIEYEGLGDSYTVQALSKDQREVTVVMQGVEGIINSIDASMIKAYIDLTDLEPGEHEVDVIVSGTEAKVTYASKIKTIKVLITK